MKTLPSLQDFSVINTKVEQYKIDYSLPDNSISFMFFALDCILGLQDDEIEESITDNYYLQKAGKPAGHDRGIDAIYIDESENPKVIHIFNCKYSAGFEKIGGFFPSGEIDKLITFISAVISKNTDFFKNSNKRLIEKVEEIWNIYKTQSPKYVIHICSNHSNGFEESERLRFENSLKHYSSIVPRYHTITDFINRVTKDDRRVVNARIRAINKNLFVKSDGDVRALIAEIDSKELLRIVMDDEEMRNDVSLENYDKIKESSILEDAFEDNVRVYLKQRSKINRGIKETALNENAHRFFYFNNGITLTCNRFEYPDEVRNPIIILENFQIVNGSQTIHALFDAFLENSKKFEHIELLLRVYETHNEELSIKIAEYTNSQNPVSSRDIRSVDFTQLKLASELEALGFFYERKKGQHFGQLKSKRIDAEKAGQALYTFYNKMPAEAKNDKKSIFGVKYDDIFNDGITADSLLLAVNLFDEIETRKKNTIKEIENEPRQHSDKSFVRFASYYILFVLSELADLNKVEKKNASLAKIIGYYDDALKLIEESILEEKKLGDPVKFSDSAFFKTTKPKNTIQKLLETSYGPEPQAME